MIDEDRDAAVGIEAKEPVFLLLVGHDVTEGWGPVSHSCTSRSWELLEKKYMRV